MTWRQGFKNASWVLHAIVGYAIACQHSDRKLHKVAPPFKWSETHTKVDLYFRYPTGQSDLSPVRWCCQKSSCHTTVLYSTSVDFSTVSWSLEAMYLPPLPMLHSAQRFGCAMIRGLVWCSIALWPCLSFTEKIVKLWERTWAKAMKDKKVKSWKHCCWRDNS